MYFVISSNVGIPPHRGAKIPHAGNKVNRKLILILGVPDTSFQKESGLGILNYVAVTETASNSSEVSNRKSTYQNWSERERFKIGKYAAQNGHAATVRKFSRNEKPLNESSVRRFCKLYKEELSKATKEKRKTRMELIPMQRGRPLMLGSLDQMVQKYLRAYRSRGGPVSSLVAMSISKVLIARNPELNLQHIDIDTSSWAKSLFQRMEFVRRMKTTGKVEIPEGAKKEAELLYLHDIVAYVEEHNIPPTLVMNLDQTPLKFVSHHTMAKKGTKSVSITGSSDKRGITGTFVITRNGDFLLLQLIYGGKTRQSLPRFKFPESFSLSVNPKHFSNTEESIKIIEEIVVPYVNRQRERLDKPNQAALLVLDVFRGQMTQEVTTLFRNNNIFFVKVPNNMTQLFQPLDLTVNGHCKSFMKKQCAEWFSKQFNNQLSLGKKAEEIEIKFPLTTIKPIHAHWVTYIVKNGWKSSGILGAINGGSSNLPSIDPFQDIAPLPSSADDSDERQMIHTSSSELMEDFVNDRDERPAADDDDSEWGKDDDFERNAFDFIIDDE